MLKLIRDFVINSYGVKTNRKIVVFLVDDYGTIRISSNEALQKLQQVAPNVVNNRFNQFDDIASVDDLTALFEILTSVKDKNSNHAVFTPMTVVANPNFEAIKESDFTQYFYESFYDTLEGRTDGKEVITLWRQGIDEGIFMPEFHGREHLNTRFWLEYLQKKDINVFKAFEFESIGIEPAVSSKKGYMAAFDVWNKEHLAELNAIVADGLNIFEELFGYRATLFTPSALLHNDKLHPDLYKNGIHFIDMARNRNEPQLDGTYKKRFHYMGQKNKNGQRYITRNVMFEPNKGQKDWVNSAIKEMEIAFTFKKPAIISSHRVNFVSGKSESNRQRGLYILKELLTQIVKKWPDVEFLSARELNTLL